MPSPSTSRQIERYLHDTLGVTVSARAWTEGRHLPHFLRERYSFAEMGLLGQPCILLVDASPAEQAAGVIRKHADQVRQKSGRPAIYVRASVTAYNRRRLIEHKVPFVVPGNQLYLPDLGIDLREHFRRQQAEASVLGPAAQVVLLHAILRLKADETITPGETAKRLCYSAMTMTRAFGELEAAKFADVAMRGRERRLRIAVDKRTVWAQAQTWLRSPVSKRLSIRLGRRSMHGLAAGLSALAGRSSLAPPPRPVLALSSADWKAFRDRGGVTEVPAGEPDSLDIEVWTYPPALLAGKDAVDPLSLYLSLRHDADERVKAALEEMMEALPW